MHFFISSDLLDDNNERRLGDFVKRFFEERIFLEFTDVEKAQIWVDGLEQKQKDEWSRLLQHSGRLKAQHNMKKMYLNSNKIKVLPNLTESTMDSRVRTQSG
ncbi:hypothetical protein [Pseudomonas syringae]|uniref:hypothetical protein n=1 Tax=Pseudomonas syringae TaxID=317 RepID=UPI003F76B0A0